MPESVSPQTLVSELVRTFKAVTMYPDGHPARKSFFDRLLSDFSMCLQLQTTFEIAINRDSVSVEGQPVVTKDGSSEFLARECFARQIAMLRFLRGVTSGDFDLLFRLMAMEPENVRTAGGALEVIRGHGSGSFQLDQVDYDGLLERRIETSSENGSLYGAHRRFSHPAGYRPGLARWLAVYR